MSLTAAFVRHEWRTQGRSLRFRLIALVYVAGCALPAVAVFLHQKESDTLFGAATYAAEVLTFQPLLTALVGAALAIDGIQREREEGAWAVVTLAAMSNAGYLLRRFIALLSVVLPLTVLPLLAAAALAAAAGAPPLAAGPFAWPWLLGIAPLAVAATALSLGLGTLADNVVVAGLALLLLLALLPAAGNDALARSRRKLTAPQAALGLGDLEQRVSYYRVAVQVRIREIRLVLPASEGAYDPRTGAERLASRLAAPLGLGLCALGAAALFLRRSRPDLAPWRIPPDHPLKSFLVLFNRLRQRYAPDPAPQASDRLALGLALVALGAAAVVFYARDTHYRELAGARWSAERAGGPPPTPVAVVPGPWSVRAGLAADGSLRSTVEAVLRNTGPTPCPRLAFSLSPELALGAVTSPRGTATAGRRWDRLEVRLDPPLAAGESRRLRFTLAGTPAKIRFNLRAGQNASFAARYGFFLTRRAAADLSDLADSSTLRAVSPRRVELAAADLLPVPRYTSWALTPPPRSEEEPGLEVPEERFTPPADLTVDLTAPPGLWLADACGHLARQVGGVSRLAGSCRLSPGDWAVRGGRLTPLPLPGATFAVLPQHLGRGRLHAAELAGIDRKIEEAWPGLRVGEPALLEWPPPFDFEPRAGMGAWSQWLTDQGPVPEAVGRVLLLPERLLAGGARIPVEGLVADLVAAQLLARRPVVPGEEQVVKRLVHALVLRRLGLAPPSGAVLDGKLWDLDRFRVPVLAPEHEDPWFRGRRLVAVVADLDHRVGASGLRRGIERFFARPGGAPGTVAELVQDIGETAGVPLDREYRDYFLGTALPEVSLEGVKLRREEGRWTIAGSLANHGTGEARCPVVATTDTGPVETEVRVEGGKSTPFTLGAALPPRALLLDPAAVCHRFRPAVPGAIVERVELRPEAVR